MPMLEFQQIIEQYPENLRHYRRAILREYLQYKILQAIFDSKHASKLAFLGGTALRIVHGNTRFSEDIDLDNFGLSWSEFEEVTDKVSRFLSLEGFDVEIKNIEKGAYHCYLRFPELLYRQGLSPLPGEKILIQVDTTSQGFSYQTENFLLNKFDVFTEIRVTPLDILLSQKLYTAVNRKRPKGRDFYDITFLVSRTKPNYAFLQMKLDIENKNQLKKELQSRFADFDFKAIAQDVAPFLMNQNEINRVEKFQQFWDQVNFG
jgi:predicted nucleotidyltransferase component of viral defense system